jgi:F-type H+-transporting ATPase subunit b
MHIDLWALALQAGNFAILAWLLQRFLYHPIARVVTQRRALVEKDFEEARQARSAAESARRDYEQSLAGITAERARVLAEARAHIEAERRQVIESAQAEAAAILATQRRQLDEERRLAAAALGDRAVDLALALSQKLLGQVGGAAVTADLLDRVCAHLASVAPERLRGRGPVLQVATLPGLDPDGQVRWRQRLVPYVGEAVEIIFVTDETLIAGAELRFPSMIVTFSWRDSLAEARTAMQLGS